jgi:hypothetical protein
MTEPKTKHRAGVRQMAERIVNALPEWHMPDAEKLAGLLLTGERIVLWHPSHDDAFPCEVCDAFKAEYARGRAEVDAARAEVRRLLPEDGSEDTVYVVLEASAATLRGVPPPLPCDKHCGTG